MTRFSLWLLSILGTMIGFALLSGFLIGLVVGSARAQHPGHAENHDWYRDLKQPGTGYSCCNGPINGVEGDCRPTRAYIGGAEPVLVPPRVVLKQLAPDGNSHICAGKSGMIYCFLGGSPKS